MKSESFKNIEKVKECVKRDKLTIPLWVLLVPVLTIVVAGWALATGRAQSIQLQWVAWIAVGFSLMAITIDLSCYYTLPNRDVYNIPPGNIRFRFIIRVIEVATIYYIALPAVAVLSDRLLGLNKLIPSPYNWLGLVILIPGMVLGSWTSRTFFRIGQGTTVNFEPTQNLVKGGPFRYIRNPMSVGTLIVMAGLAVILSSYVLLILFLFLIPVSHIYVVNVEEKELEVRFGQPFLEYKNSVPRWFPRRQKRTNPSVA
jgi:protein-S-isoprenylcysteine O-methyltransferase Ste14